MRCFGMRLAGDQVDEVDERGRRIEGDTILVLFNAHHEPIPFTLPGTLAGQRWEHLLDTADPTRAEGDVSVPYPLGRALSGRVSYPESWNLLEERGRVPIPLGPRKDVLSWRLR